MTKDEAIKFWGGPTRLAKALGITRDAVHKWKNIPAPSSFLLSMLHNIYESFFFKKDHHIPT